MSTHPTILVTSAAGKTGLPTALQLRERGFPVRAFVRHDDARAEKLRRVGADIFIGNQYDLTDMRRAMAGIQRAYHCAPTAPNGLHFNAIFAAAADEARVEHIVSMGQWLSSADHPSVFTREVYISDVLIGALPHATRTIVNPGWFADNYLMVLDLAAHLGLFAMPLGPGDEAKNAPPSNEDIASVVVEALVDPAAHAGKTYRPTGPELISPNQIAIAMGNALGRKVKYMNISERMMFKALKALPPPNYSDEMATQLAVYAEEYRRGAFAVSAPTDIIAWICGRQSEDFESIVRRYVAARPDLRPSVGGTLGAMAGFAKMLLTRPPNPVRVAEARGHVKIAKPRFVQDSAEWRAAHDFAAAS
ncbi:MAG: NmrA family NAD(P)-binding protein [Pseudomonadota bacterium]